MILSDLKIYMEDLLEIKYLNNHKSFKLFVLEYMPKILKVNLRKQILYCELSISKINKCMD